jgi:hypothetical protein
MLEKKPARNVGLIGNDSNAVGYRLYSFFLPLADYEILFPFSIFDRHVAGGEIPQGLQAAARRSG